MKRSIAIALAALTIVGTLVPTTGVARAADAELPLRECISKERSLSVLFLVDTSASLRTTDPRSQRVTALQLAVSSLAAERKAEVEQGRDFSVFVDFLSFGTRSRRTFGQSWPQWGELSDGGAGFLMEAIKGFRAENKDTDTDYVSALSPTGPILGTSRPEGDIGALDMLSSAPENSCRLLVWFTDGEFDFDPPKGGGSKSVTWTDVAIRNESDVNTVKQQGAGLLCGRDGLADQLRRGGISSGTGAQVAAVVLGDNPSRFDLIRSIVSGGLCGDAAARGEVYPASDVNDLFFSLQKAVAGPGVGLPDDRVASCPVGRACDQVDPQRVEEFDYPFNLTAGVASFNMVALEGDERISTLLISPTGESVVLDQMASDTTLSNGVKVHVQPFEASPAVHLVHADLPDDPAGWAGRWRVRFVAMDPALNGKSNRAALYVFAGTLGLRLRDGDAVLRRGRVGKSVIELVTSGGQAVARPEFMPSPDLVLRVDGKPVDVGSIHPDGTWEVDIDVPDDFKNDRVTLEADLSAKVQVDPSLPVVTLDSWPKLNLGSLEVRALPKYPLLDDPISPFASSLNQKRTTVSSTLHVDSESAESGGCVTLESVTQPVNKSGSLEGVVRVLANGAPIEVGQDCALKLGPGQSADLTVEVSIDKSAVKVSDVVAGELTLRSVSEVDPSQQDSFTKPFTTSIEPVFSIEVDWFRVAWLTLLAVLGAFAVLYTLNFIGARLSLGRSAHLLLPVVFSGGRLYRSDAGGRAPVTFEDDELNVLGMPSPGSYREVEIGPVRFQGRMAWSPFSDSSGSATVDNRNFVVANQGSAAKGKRGRLLPTLADAWTFFASQPPQRTESGYGDVSGNLLMLLPARPEEARRKVTALLSRIEERVGDSCQAFATDVPSSEPDVPVDAERPAAGGEGKFTSPWTDDPVVSSTQPVPSPVPTKRDWPRLRRGGHRSGGAEPAGNPLPPQDLPF